MDAIRRMCMKCRDRDEEKIIRCEQESFCHLWKYRPFYRKALKERNKMLRAALAAMENPANSPTSENHKSDSSPQTGEGDLSGNPKSAPTP